MSTRIFYIFLLAALWIVGIVLWRATRAGKAFAASSVFYRTSWNPAAAANYLDNRELWWQSWPPAQQGHGTVCISCHTVVPYALARPALQQQLGATEMPAAEKTMLASIETRVGHWSETTPFYSDAADGPGKTAQSRATEAVLNAVILSSYDTRRGHLRPITRTALSHAWALQEQSGGWKWQDFHLAPWESADSDYQGAALLAVALGNAPDRYAEEPDISQHMKLLKEYLRSRYAAQPVMSRLYVLWASAHMDGLLDAAQRRKLLAEIGALQQSDGGWALSSLDTPAGLGMQAIWKRLQNAPSDGCATGLVVLALEESGVDSRNQMLDRGLEWLRRRQTKDGSWRASSLNAQRDPNSDIGRFMNDAATGYAVLALEAANKQMNQSGAF